MKTLLTLGPGNSSEPATVPGVFGIISGALEQAGRKLACWDANRLDRSSQRTDVTPDHTVTHENLALAYATS